MKLRTIQLLTETQHHADTRIYHTAHLWPGGFAHYNHIDPKDAREAGYDTNNLLLQTNDDVISRISPEFQPHPQYIDYLLQQPDQTWLDYFKTQMGQFTPNPTLENIKIIDKDFNGHDMLLLKYIADVNLKQFLKANDWNQQDMAAAIKAGDFKIIKQL